MTATIKPTRWTGPFTSGEKPLPFLVRFDPTDLDLSAFTVAATLEDDDGSEMTFDGLVQWNDASTGTVEVTLGADDVAVPVGKLVITRRLMIWAGDNTFRPATVAIKYNCHPSIGTPPSI